MSEKLPESGLKKHKVSILYVVGMVYCLCAAGAYGIEDMIPSAGPGLTLLLLLIIPIFWALPQVLCAAELGSAIPAEGGYYRWIQRSMGEFWGFQAGWWKLINSYLCNAAYVVLAGSYIVSMIPMSEFQAYLLKAAIVVIVTVVNLFGIKEVSALSTIFAVLILIAFAGVTMVGFAHWGTNPMDPIIPPEQSWIESIGYGLAIGMWMYSGFQSVTTVTGEIENPKVVSKGILIALPIIIASYALPTLAGLASIGNWSQWGSDGLSYGDIIALAGPGFKVAFLVVAILANLSMFNAYTAASSRIFFALAEDNMSPKFITKCSKKFGVPYVAVIILGIFNLILCQFQFKVIVLIDVTLSVFVYALVFMSTVVLRKREPDMPRPIRIPTGLGGVTIIAGSGLAVVFLALFLNGLDYFVGGSLIVLTGPIAYYILRLKYGGLNAIDPQHHQVNPRTQMPFGDLKRMFRFFLVMFILGGIGCIWFPLYEDPQYYIDFYGSGVAYAVIMKGLYLSTAICVIGMIVTGILHQKTEVHHE